MKFHEGFARWPLLLAGVTLVSAGVALDLGTQAPVAFGLFALAAASFGGFMYAEGARHRDWNDAHRPDPEPAPWSDEEQTNGKVDP
jgi:hypothetical protein